MLLDVRSPSEYAKGHAPGAHSLPLFSDEERAKVGICYKQNGQEAAIRLGLKLVGPKMGDLVSKADELIATSEQPTQLYCWRGGMRSASMQWLLETAGHSINRWEGGYKAYRHRVLQAWSNPPPLVVLSGLTGSGKTEILHAMQGQVQTLDLEGMANHKGSAFGALGEAPQPTNEMFENYGAQQIDTLEVSKPLWIEDESRSIGRIFLPTEFMTLKKEAPIVVIQRTDDERVQHLTELYGQADREALADSFDRIRRRLGDLRTNQCIEALLAGDIAYAAREALHYYDRTYHESLARRKSQVITTIQAEGMTWDEIAKEVIRKASPLLTSSQAS